MSFFNEYLTVEGFAQIQDYFRENGEFTVFDKNDFFLKSGDPTKKIGLIKDGGFRFLYYSTTGDEQVVGYSFEDDLVTSYPAMMRNLGSITSIQAIQNSSVYVLSRDKYFEYLDKYDKNNVRSQIAETFLLDIYRRMLCFYSDPIEDRYIRLLKRYPQIVNKVSLKEIASFVHTTPETLSRIRKKMVSDI